MAVEKGRGNRKRRIWEFQSFTICGILGLSFDEKKLRALFKELKLNPDGQFSAAPEMQQQLVQICRTQGLHAKQIEKILEKRFAAYKNQAGISDPQKICDFIECKKGAENSFTDVPIPALIWFAARNRSQNKDSENNNREIETRIIAAVHLKEHQALRFYDELLRKLPRSKPEDIIEELKTALESNEKIQQNYKRLEQKREELISEREALKEDKARLLRELEEQKRLEGRLRRKLNEAGGEATVEQFYSMRDEMGVLREELKRVNKENAEMIKIISSPSNFNTKEEMPKEDNFAASACNCNHNEKEMGHQLKDVRVAYVGGVESLETCYKEMAESFGCRFCYHCGHCEGGKRAIESLVDKNDVIFCPIDINSHNACLLVKKACKLRDKHCYFLRSSGLSALKKGLMNFAVCAYGHGG